LEVGKRRQGEKGSFEVKKLGRLEKVREMTNDKLEDMKYEPLI